MKVIPAAMIGSTMGFGLFEYKIWGSWSAWSDCDSNQLRTREAPCLSRAPFCQNPLIERTSSGCKEVTWGEWGDWGLCNPRTKQRQRTAACIAGPPKCNNALIERESCSTNELTIWGRWAPWGVCDQVTRKRSRTAACISGPPKCNNPLIEYQVCGETVIPEETVWGAWGSWSSCTGGKTRRQAACMSGPPKCNNPLIEEKDCFTPPAPIAPQCTVPVAPSLCASNPPITELNGALCAYSTLCTKKPSIFKPVMFGPFGPYRFCTVSTIHAIQNCLARQNRQNCAGLNERIITKCWNTWKRTDYWMGNILTPQG